MTLRNAHALAAILSCLFALPGFADAAIATFELTPVADTTIFEEASDRANGAGAFAFVGNTAGGVARRALMRFDLSGILPGSTVVSAELFIYVNRAALGLQDSTTAVHRLEAEWGTGASDSGDSGAGALAGSGDATWSHRFWDSTQTWSASGGDFDATPSAVTDLTSSGASIWSGAGLGTDVQTWIDDPTTNFGWILLSNEDLDRTAHRFSASEIGTASVRPALRLEVMPIPEPSTYATFGAGVLLLGLAIGHHRRKR